MAVGCLRRAVSESQVVGKRIETISQKMAQKLELDRQRFQIRIANDDRMPVAFWLGRWIVILPATSNKWDDQRLYSVLAHELGHVSRRDALADFIGQLALVVYWFHPLFWFALIDSKRLREQACDDLVVNRAMLSPTEYARNLLDVVSNCSSICWPNRLASAIASSNDIETRIQRILNGSISMVPSRLLVGTVFSIATCALIASPMVRLALAESMWQVEIQEEFLMSASGKVINVDGKPYSDAEVTMRIIPSACNNNISLSRYSDLMARVKTDANGNFTISRAAIPEPFRDDTRKESERHQFELLIKTPDCGLTNQPLVERNSSKLEIQLKPRGIIEGIVVDDKGRPLANALIEAMTIADADAPFSRFGNSLDYSNFIFSSLAPATKSDELGNFRFDGLPDNARVICWVSHESCPRVTLFARTGTNSEPLTVKKGDSDDKLTFRASPVRVEMTRGHQIVASVVDQSDNPVESIVHVFGNANEYDLIANDQRMWKYSGALSKAGKYRINAHSINSNFIVGQSFLLDEFSLELAERVEVKLPDTRRIKGQVVDDLGNPVSGILIHWNQRLTDDENHRSYTSSANTDADGNFDIEVTPGKGKLFFRFGSTRSARGVLIPDWQATTDGHDKPNWAVNVPDNGDYTAEKIVLSRGLVVSGVVRDANGEPVANAKVSALSPDSLMPKSGSATSDAQGKYEIAGLNPRNSYKLRVSTGSENLVVKTDRFDDHPFSESRLLSLDLKTKTSVALFGRVLLDGKPYVNLPIVLKETNHYITEVSSTKTDAEGRYRLTGVFPGDHYSVEINPPIPLLCPGWEHQDPFAPTVPRDAGKEVELEDMNLVPLTQTVSGRIVDPDGKPVEGATISARMADGRMLGRFLDYPTPWAESDAEGNFTISHLPAEPVRLMAYMPPTGEDRLIRNSVNVHPELNETGIEIELDPTWN